MTYFRNFSCKIKPSWISSKNGNIFLQSADYGRAYAAFKITNAVRRLAIQDVGLHNIEP